MDNRSPTPESVAINPLEQRILQYQEDIRTNGNRIGLSRSTVLKALGFVVAADAVLFGPSIVEAYVVNHLNILSLQDLIAAHAYAIGSTFTAGTLESVPFVKQIERIPEVWGGELPKFAAEWRKFINDVAFFGTLGGAAERYFHKEAVRQGEANIKKSGEQLFIYGGRSSNFADALAIDEPEHTIAIFDNPKGGSYLLSKLMPLKHGLAKIPQAIFAKSIFLSLGLEGQDGSHRELEAWQRLDVNEGNLIHTTDGKKLLVSVGCGEWPENELRQMQDVPDITLEETHTYSEMVANRFRSKGITDFQEVKIYLGSADTERLNSITNIRNLTDRDVAVKGGINIYIDSWRANLWGLKRKLEEQGKLKNGIVLVSSVPEYRKLFQQIGEGIGIEIFTPVSEEELTTKYSKATLCVYEEVSDATLNAARRLTASFKDRSIIALTSHLPSYEAATREKIDTVCSAVVIRDLIKSVVHLLRKGKNPTDIQQLIDNLLNGVKKQD